MGTNTTLSPDLLGSILANIETDMQTADPRKVTGLTDLDALTGGLFRGRLTVIASRPGTGTSTLLTNICRTASIGHDIPTAVFTVQDSPGSFTTRVLAAEASVARLHIHNGTLADGERARLSAASERIATAPLRIYALPVMTIRQLEAEIADLVLQHGVGLVAIDGIQNIQPGTEDAAASLAAIARELVVPIVATSQLMRYPWGVKPTLDDLAESVAFAADTVILLHREDGAETPRVGEADLIVAHRSGPCATVTVAFEGRFGRLVDMAPAE